MRKTHPVTGLTQASTTAELLKKFSELMSKGQLSRGQRLPSERALAEQFKTTRASLRQAMKVLETVGVISQRVGDGSYLSADASNIMKLPLTFMILLDEISILELFDVRLMFEPEVAARAAERASGEDLGMMRETLGCMLTDTASADAAFHEAICKATGNRVCQRMFEAVHDALTHSMQVTAKLAPGERALEFHKQIYSAIHLRRPEEARKKMIDHLSDAQTVLLSAFLERKVPIIVKGEPGER